MNFSRSDISGMRVTVMGLGLHGGGTASALFFAGHGAEVTVTDLRSEEELSESIGQLDEFPIRYVLGRHDEEDFGTADLVIKNPGVPGDSPFLKKAPRVETDISVFLRLVDPPLLAVTGTKGKSTVVSALHYIVSKKYPEAKLGGNITVSPLTFTDELLDGHGKLPPVILELSSWQLADLRGKGVLKPAVACITNIMHDHQNRYETFTDYVEDKREIFRGQGRGDTGLFLFDEWGKRFASETKGEALFYSHVELPEERDGAWLGDKGEGFLRYRGELHRIVPRKLALPGGHNRLNLLCAGTIAFLSGVGSEDILERAGRFSGIPHRLEFVREIRGVRFYNDSAATIPDAVLEGVRSFPGPCVLITGGTDKELDFRPYEEIARLAGRVVLLAGSGTDKIIPILREKGVPYYGPYEKMEPAVQQALESAPAGGVVLLSPGCASFEYFTNEFHRGNRFKEAVAELE